MNKQITSDKEKQIRNLVRSHMLVFAQTFSERHINQVDNPEGTLNMKIHNVFDKNLGFEKLCESALNRSYDSSHGIMLEKLAISVANLFYVVKDTVEGSLYPEQISKIAELLGAYKDNKNPKKASVEDYSLLTNIKNPENCTTKKRKIDLYLYDEESDKHILIELKSGGDLDTKKASAEKAGVFELYAILSNTLGKLAKIRCFFATAYNRYGEGKPWKQSSVRQYFSNDELLIGKDFWNLICKSENGYDIVIDEYNKNFHIINDGLNKINKAYSVYQE